MKVSEKVILFVQDKKGKENQPFKTFSTTISSKRNEEYINKTLEVRFNTENIPLEKLNKLSSDRCYTLEVEDGNNVEQITAAINLAKQSKDKPSFIKINTHIGYGSVLEDSNKAHGSCLGEENVALLREKLGVKANKFELEKDVNRAFNLLTISAEHLETSFNIS